MIDREDFWAELLERSQGVGARRERVKIERLLATVIPLPALDEQRRIGAIGAKLTELSTSQARQRQTAEALVPAAINQALSADD